MVRYAVKSNAILLVTNTDDLHADAFVDEVTRRNTNCFRFNTDLMGHHSSFSWTTGGYQITEYERIISSESIGTVIWRRPSPPKSERLRRMPPGQIQFAGDECLLAINGLIRSGTPERALWISHPDNLRRANPKPSQLRIAQQLGFNVPETLITNEPEAALAFVRKHGYRVAAKVAGRGPNSLPENASLYTINLSRSKDKVDETIESVALAPVLFQEYVEKLYELRVTFFGTNCIAVKIDSQNVPECVDDWRRVEFSGNEDALNHEPFSLDERTKYLCLKMLKCWGLNYGCFDFAVDRQNRIMFLELNPNGQFLWMHEILPELRMLENWVDLALEQTDPVIRYQKELYNA